jgi:amino acid transporter
MTTKAVRTKAVTHGPVSPAAAPKGNALRRNYLSALENVAQAVGTMGPAATLGTVIPLLIAKTGNGTWLLFLGILGVFILISININVFASRFASAGSLSSYAEKGIGGWPGILTGWSYIVAMTFVVTSSVVASAYYLGMVLAHFTDHSIGKAGSLLLTSLLAVLAWLPAYRDIKLSTKVMLTTEAISVGVIVLILGVAMWRTAHGIDQAQLHLAGTGFPQFKMGFVLAFMMLAGFESATTLGEEAQSATRTIPRVMFFCLLPVGLLFMVSIYATTWLSHDRSIAFGQTSAPLDLIARSIDLPALGWISSLGVALSCFGCAVGGLNAGARVIFSMARARLFAPFFARIHPVNGTPSRALLMIGLVALVIPGLLITSGVAMANAMDYLMQIASFGFLGGYFSVCVAAPFYLARQHTLTVIQLLVALITLLVIGAVGFLSLIPIPDAPWCYLPYCFATLVLMGTLSTVYFRSKIRP